MTAITTDSDSRVRAWGTGTLRGVNDAASIAALKTLAKDASEWTRKDALIQFAECTDPSRQEILLAALSDSSPLVRSTAAHKLKTMNSPPVIAALKAALDDSDASVREAAIVSLVELKAQLSAQPKLDALRIDDPSSKVRYRARQALGR